MSPTVILVLHLFLLLPAPLFLPGGNSTNMTFLARNHQSLVYKYSIHSDYFKQGLDMEAASAHHKRMAKARELMDVCAATPGSYVTTPAQLRTMTQALNKGSVVLAKRKWKAELPWGRGNILKSW
jgi:hypothetical protein